jgi:hypothetical protein
MGAVSLLALAINVPCPLALLVLLIVRSVMLFSSTIGAGKLR